MSKPDIHLIKGVQGRHVVTWCGLIGGPGRRVDRYQMSTCGKCRREYRKEY